MLSSFFIHLNPHWPWVSPKFVCAMYLAKLELHWIRWHCFYFPARASHSCLSNAGLYWPPIFHLRSLDCRLLALRNGLGMLKLILFLPHSMYMVPSLRMPPFWLSCFGAYSTACMYAWVVMIMFHTDPCLLASMLYRCCVVKMLNFLLVSSSLARAYSTFWIYSFPILTSFCLAS